MDLGERIEFLANECGGIASLSRHCGVSRTALQGFVTRGNKPSRRTLMAIQGSTGCSWEWLVDGVGATPKIAPERLRSGLARESQPTPDAQATGMLDKISRRVMAAIEKADQNALETVIPNAPLALYRYGISIPGANHMAVIAMLAKTTVSDLMGEE